MAYTTINKSTDNFNTVLYTGNGSARTITTGMQPDLNWIKRRNQLDNHWWTDSVRGATKYIGSNRSNAEATETTAVTGITSTGFTLGDDSNQGEVNANTYTYCSWNWKANGAGSANTDGTINSTVSVNTTAGFSVVTWTGSGSSATIGHGLGSTPKMIIVKNRTDAVNWMVYHNSVVTASATNKSFMTLNTTDTLGTNGSATTFTSVSNTTFGVGTDNIVNGSSDNMIAYVFAEKQGYSKIGSFTGNGNADGTFIHTGFRPAFILVRASNLITNWHLYDNKRDPINPADIILRANANNAEATSSEFAYDFVSNGFKARSSGAEFNGSGNTFIYYAVGQSLVGSNNVPSIAR